MSVAAARLVTDFSLPSLARAHTMPSTLLARTHIYLVRGSPMRILTVLALFACASLVRADDKDKDELKGTFTKKAGDFDLTFKFEKAGEFTFKMSNGTDGCVMDVKYTKEKDGLIKAEVTKFEKIGNFGAEKEKGYKFTMKAKLKDKKLEISEIEGDDISEDAKQTVQGEYEPSN
jgi:hypothetical protein